MKRFNARVNGFTLLEVLMALAIMGLAASCSYGVLQTSLLRFRQLKAKTQYQRDAAVALALMAKDIRSALITSDSNTTFVGHHEEFGDRLEFFRMGGLPDPTPKMEPVAYLVVEDPQTGERRLQRRSHTDSVGGANDRTIDLCPKISAFTVRYFDGDSWRDQWDWDASGKKAFSGIRGLPLLVAVRLLMKDADDQTYEEKVVIPVMTCVLNRASNV